MATYFIKTYGCQQNHADSERISGTYQSRGFIEALNATEADTIVVNTCIVKKRAEDKAYGFIRNVHKYRVKNKTTQKIVVTGCLVGAAAREPSGARLRHMHESLPEVDEFLPIEEIGFETTAVRKHSTHAFVPVTHGCNNFCTFCIVPFSRGKESSRPYESVVEEIVGLAKNGYTNFTLLGQNVNSYGADLVKESKEYTLDDGKKLTPIYVKHLGKMRIPTLFPHLLETIANIDGVLSIDLLSPNPWDFSEELIDVIARNANISRLLHLPVQSGDNEVLKKMSRWYTREEYMDLTNRIRKKIPDASFITDIIVGFPGETEQQFQNTVALAKEVGFIKSFTSCYSPRVGTASEKMYKDDVPHEEKKRRFRILDSLINITHQHDFQQKSSGILFERPARKNA